MVGSTSQSSGEDDNATILVFIHAAMINNKIVSGGSSM